MRKHAAWLLLLLIPAVLVLGHFAGFSGDDSRVAAAPPLSLDKYLDEKLPEATKEEVKLKADNFACYVCHGNYKEEVFVIWHGKADIGCVKCHGDSHDHRNDEDNIIPPEKMYPADQIEKCCVECHKQHDAPAVEVLARWQERCPEKTNPKDLVCTDCHGQHRLKLRTVRWDKKTGKVLDVKKKDEKPAVDSKAAKPDGTQPPPH